MFFLNKMVYLDSVLLLQSGVSLDKRLSLELVFM